MAHAFKNGMPVKIIGTKFSISDSREEFVGLSGIIDDKDADDPSYRGAFWVLVTRPDGSKARESFHVVSLSPSAPPTPRHPFRDGMRVKIRSDKRLPSDEMLFAGLIGIIRDKDADDPTYANGALYVYFSDDVLSTEVRKYIRALGNKEGTKSFELSSLVPLVAEDEDQAEMIRADGEQVVRSGPGDDDDDGESLPIAAFASFTTDQDFPFHLGGFFGK